MSTDQSYEKEVRVEEMIIKNMDLSGDPTSLIPIATAIGNK